MHRAANQSDIEGAGAHLQARDASPHRQAEEQRGRLVRRHLGLFAAGFVVSAAVVPLALSASTAPANAPHVMIVMMENESASSVIGNSQMPFTNSLATGYGEATNSFAFGHPSLPNYLDIVSGSNQGVTQDQPPSSGSFPNAPTIANQLESAGLTVGAYAENLPADPSNDGGASDSAGSPIYAVRHAPLGTGYFPNDGVTINDASTLTSDLNASSAPDFVFFTPNMIDDGHDGSPAQADSFLKSFVPEVQATSWYTNGGQIIVEWDEGADSDTSGIGGGDGGHIPTIVVSQALKSSPQQYSGDVDTAGILHSVESVYGLAPLGGGSADGTLGPLLSAAPAPAAAQAPAPAPAPTPAPAPAPAAPVKPAPAPAPAAPVKPAPAPVAAPKPAPAPAPKPAPSLPSLPSPTKVIPSPLALGASSPAHAATPASAAHGAATTTGKSAAPLATSSAPAQATTPPAASTSPASVLGADATSASPPAHARHSHSTSTGNTDGAPLTLTNANASGHASGSGIVFMVVSFVIGVAVCCVAATAWRRRTGGTPRGAHSPGREHAPADSHVTRPPAARGPVRREPVAA